MLAEVGQNQEQSNKIEFFVDSGAACHAWPCKTKPGSTRGGTFLTATGAPDATQGTLDVSCQLLDGHGVVINVRATFELLLVRRPILSVSRLVEKGFAVVMGEEAGKHVEKGRESDTSAQIQWCVPRPSLVKRPCHGHDTNPQRTRDWHTRLATCHSELGVRTV